MLLGTSTIEASCDPWSIAHKGNSTEQEVPLSLNLVAPTAIVHHGIAYVAALRCVSHSEAGANDQTRPFSFFLPHAEFTATSESTVTPLVTFVRADSTGISKPDIPSSLSGSTLGSVDRVVLADAVRTEAKMPVPPRNGDETFGLLKKAVRTAQ